MPNKVKLLTAEDGGQMFFHCPGCGYGHAVRAGGNDHPHKWAWNGSYDLPTFSPSILTGHTIEPSRRCHSFVRGGRIEFLNDCWHDLRGQTVELPDWDTLNTVDVWGAGE